MAIDLYGTLKNVVLSTVFILSISILSMAGKQKTNPNISQDPDSSIYFADYSELLAIRMYTNTKWNTLDIIRDDQRLSLKPNSPTSLGAGFNYKEYGLAIAFGLPKSASSNQKYGKTKRLDVQMNVYSPKIGIDGFAQLYRGYYNANPDDFMEWESEELPQIPDMRVVSIGVNAFYLFNDERFSYKAAFVRNQIQLKSAGSFTVGVFGHYDLASTENGFKPSSLPDSIATSFDLRSFSTLASGVSVGYLYTWLITKNLFLNVGITPGFGNQRIELESIDDEKSVKNAPAAQLAARAALGYDSKYFYVGMTGMVIWRSFEYKGYDLDLSTEQFKVFVGKRFSIRKKR